MMSYNPILPSIVMSVAALATMPMGSAQALKATEVSAIAEDITILIDGQNPGSGVLIKRKGNTYTALTAAHVVATDDEYELVTSDQQRHQLDYKRVKKFPGVDLALVEFTSSNTYKIAKLGDSSTIKSGASVYLSGFPMPTQAITESIWNFSPGTLTANANRPLEDGYGLVYNNNTLPGMSGGAVLDEEGQLVGIHGRADSEQRTQKSETIYIKTGFNLGIPINTFLNQVPQVSPVLGFTPKNAPPLSTKLTADDWYLQAVEHARKRDYAQGLASIENAIQAKPDYADAYVLRGVFHILQSTNSHANLNPEGGAIKLKPNVTDAELDQVLQKSVAQAKADFDQAIQIQPDFLAAYIVRGLAHRALGNTQSAITDYTKAIQLEPKSEESFYERGKLHNEQGNQQQAIADFTEAVRINPDLMDGFYQRGLIHYAQNKHPEAIADFDKAIALTPNQNENLYFNRGLSQYAIGNHTAAIKSYSQAIQSRNDYAEAYLNRGASQIELGNKAEAIADFTQAIQFKPELADAYSNRGSLYTEAGQYPKALKDLNKAIQLKPNSVEAHYNLAALHYSLGDPTQALAAYDIAIQLKPNYLEALFNRGLLRYQVDNKQGAIEDFTKAIEFNKDLGEAYYSRALTLRDLGRTQEAIADLKIASQLLKAQGKQRYYQYTQQLLQEIAP